MAIGYASNAVGTINPVAEIVARAHEVGALVYVDAVAYAPHGPIDVRALDADFLVCSAYKWFGPHLGALYGKAEVLERLPAFKVRPAHDRFETGTASFESIAGTLAATDYLRDIGRSFGDVAGAPGAAAASERRRELVAGMVAIVDYERDLVGRLIDGLGSIAGVTIHGIADRGRAAERVPTVSDLDRWRRPPGGRRGPRRRRDLRLGRRLLCDRPHRAARQGRGRRGPPPGSRPLQHGRRGGPDPRGDRAPRPVSAPSSIRARLARPFDTAELRRIKRLWVRHSIAEDARDIDGLIATLSPDCVYEIVPTGQRWEGHDGARAFYSELFGAFPDNAFALSEIVIGPQGAFEVATLTGTNSGPWAGVAPSGLAVSLEVLILFPWDPVAERFSGERIWFDRGTLPTG